MHDKKVLWALVIVQFVMLCTYLKGATFNEKEVTKVNAHVQKTTKRNQATQKLVTRVVEERSPQGHVRTTRETIRSLAFDATNQLETSHTVTESIKTKRTANPNLLFGITHPLFSPYNPREFDVSVGFKAIDILTHPIYITTQTNVKLDEVRVGITIGL